MDINQYRIAFNTQKANAKNRGIKFLLTFQEWCEFWGADIDRRGSGQCDLQMQRIGDRGAYEMSNIRKGTPKQNSLTHQCNVANSKADQAAAEHQIALDAMMNEPSPPPYDEVLDDDIKELTKLTMKSSKQIFSGRFYG